MSNLINRNKGSLFKKRHFIATLRWTVAYLTWFFGYKRKPLVFESVNEDGVMMCICSSEEDREIAIFYDYMQWRRAYGNLPPDEQEASVMYVAAHEMRHYYQLRQLNSKKPTESAQVLDGWRYNHENPKYVGDSCSVFEFFMQPMELDATLFAYLFTAEKTDILMDTSHAGEGYLAELEKEYRKLSGKSDEELFPKALLEN